MEKALDLIYQKFIENPSVVTDSRKVKNGDIFFALKGDRFDGNQFAEKVMKSGASMAVVDDAVLTNVKGCVLVENVLSTLQQLANKYRNSLKTRIIGITGSNGKTTTKELIANVLSTEYLVQATQGNLNNHIGVPLTLLQIKADTEFAVIEMGANHPGEIYMLSKIAEPEFGLVTNIGKAHLEGFGGFQGVIKTKTELYQFIRNNNGMLFTNSDNLLLSEHSKGIKAITYGTGPDANYKGSLISEFPFADIMFNCHGKKYIANSKLSGGYNFENIMAAVAIGLHFDVSPDNIINGIESYNPTNNRSQVLQTPSNLLIMDAYNANPTSMEASIRFFASSNYAHKVLILGEMLELGDESPTEHKQLVDLVESLGFEQTFFVGKSFQNAGVADFWFKSKEELIAYLKLNPLNQKTILVKGSRGNALETLIDYL